MDLCDLSLEVPVCVPRIPDCLNDLMEPNDSFAEASPLERDAGPEFDELKLCQGDIDWFRIDVDAGTYLTIDARFRHTDGDLDLQLFLPDGRTLLDEARSVTDNERVEIEAGTDLVVYVRAFLTIPSPTPVPYRLVVAHDLGAICADDAHEPDDLASSAKPLVSDTPYEGRVCPGDPDWFVIRAVPVGTELSLALDFSDTLGDLDLELYRPGSTTPLLVANSRTDGEQLSYDASFGGDFFLRVFGKQSDSNVYTLRVELREANGAVCIDDPFEPNNDRNQTTRSPEDTGEVASDLSLCVGDEDWYQVALSPTEVLTAEIGFRPGRDLDLELYAPLGTPGSDAPIRASAGVAPREFLAFSSLDQGDYLLRVHAPNNADSTPYELTVKRRPPLTCEPDIIDEIAPGNDLLENATDLGVMPTRLDELPICEGDEDWYRIFLLGGFVNHLRIQYVDAEGTLDFSAHDQNGILLAQTQGTGSDSKELVAPVPGAGVAIVFLRVFKSVGLETSYSIVGDLSPIFSCFDDALEPNNELTRSSSSATAGPLTPIVLQNLTLCTSARDFITGAGDEDWFTIVPPVAGAQISARIDHAQGDLFLELLSPGGLVRACPNFGEDRCFSDGFDLNEEITFTATVSAPYFLRVGSVYSSPNALVSPPDADTPYNLRIDYTLP
jgi:hypothetical protein